MSAHFDHAEDILREHGLLPEKGIGAMTDTPDAGAPDQGFWGGYEPMPLEDLPPFIEKEEKEKIIADGTTLYVHRVRHGGGNFGEQAYVDVSIETPEADRRTISFADRGDVETREHLLEQMRDYLRNGGDPIACRLVTGVLDPETNERRGRFHIFEPV